MTKINDHYRSLPEDASIVYYSCKSKIRVGKLTAWRWRTDSGTLAKRPKTLANWQLAKRLVGETTVIRFIRVPEAEAFSSVIVVKVGVSKFSFLVLWLDKTISWSNQSKINQYWLLKMGLCICSTYTLCTCIHQSVLYALTTQSVNGSFKNIFVIRVPVRSGGS